jgi:hypothetical protein
VIGIDEGTVQAPCQLATHRRLSRARHADQEDIVLFNHMRIVAAQNRGAGKSRPLSDREIRVLTLRQRVTDNARCYEN